MSLIWLGVIGSILTVVGFGSAIFLYTRIKENEEKKKEDEEKIKKVRGDLL
jgi:preprotein translocase subunit SecF|tara:strand:+ start:297 stop:449 length:153 start_codon:yes stop_codon:yes gene_type:complete